METAGSVSKGCFAFKGKNKLLRVENYMDVSKSAGSERRHQVFVQMWEDIDTQIQILQSDLNTKIFEELLQFASSSHAGFCLQKDSVQSVTREIPTAALVTGVNTPDHSVMFSNLLHMLRDNVTPLVAILKSKDCQNVKGILARTLAQLLESPNLSLDDSIEDDTVKSKNLPLTLSTLAKWYKNKYTAAPCSPTKKRKTDNDPVPGDKQYPSMVVVFEDFESFSPRVVQDFITIASNYMDQLPLVFVFGIATSVSAVHRLLPNDVSSLLCMEKFQAPPSTEYLTLVINQILMTPKFPFKLGYKVFQLLLDVFLYHDFSVVNFNKGLRFAMLDHYFSQPVSYLCCSLEDIPAIVGKLSKPKLEQLRQLPSFMRYVENCSASEQPDLLLNDSVTKSRIESLIEDIHFYHEHFFPVLRCLNILVARLPGYPLGKQLREVYSMSLENSICESESYKQAMELLKMMSKDELKGIIEKSLKPLQDGPEGVQDFKAGVQSFLQRFDTLDDILEEDEPVECDQGETNMPTKTSLHQLRQHLQDVNKRKKKLTPYEKLRIEIVDHLHSRFSKYLHCPKSVPLYEIFYYESVSNIKRHLTAAPRSSLQMALSNPQHYLQCSCCKIEEGQVTAVCETMPDVCIVYKLHLECGQLINLFDWMQAFNTVVNTDVDEAGDKLLEGPDKQLQARFIQAVSELQFLGFIKPTKRKTDHVARLTWGGC